MTIDVKALREALAGMSPGPWGIDETDDDIIGPDGTVLGYMYDGNTGRAVNALRNAAPALLDRIAALEAGLRDLLHRHDTCTVDGDAIARLRALAGGGVP